MLSPTPGVFRTTILEKYATERECRSEQARITEAMEESYPGDTSYTIECQLLSNETKL